MPLDHPDNEVELTKTQADQAEAKNSFLGMLESELADKGGTLISRLPTDELERVMHDTKRLYLDLDETMLPAGTTTFSEHTLRVMRLLLDHDVSITFLTGKPWTEIQTLLAEMPEDLHGRIRILYEKGAYQYSGTQSAPERFLTTEEIERTMAQLQSECLLGWSPILAQKHGIKLDLAGDGTHRSILSIDLVRTDAPLGTPRHERAKWKIDPNDPRVPQIKQTLQELIDRKTRTLPLHLVDLGNCNIEIEIPDIDKGVALAQMEAQQSPESGRAMVIGDSGNDTTLFWTAKLLKNVSVGLVHHERTPKDLAEIADFGVAGAVRGHRILEKVAQSKGLTDQVIVVSNTPSLQRTEKNEFKNRMGAPVAIGAVVRQTRDALWFYPSSNGDDFSDYPDTGLRGKFRPVSISKEEYHSQYNVISNERNWFWAHPKTFPTIEPSAPEHLERYIEVSKKIAKEIDESVLSEDPTYVSTHDFQVLPVAEEFRNRGNDGANYRPNIRFHLFWHIPFPGPKTATSQMASKDVEQMLRWLMAYDVVGFHTKEYEQNYLALCSSLADRGIRPAKTLVQPISIDVDEMRQNATDVALAKDYRFKQPELNKFFQLDLHPDKREEVIMAPPERADPIKGGKYRLCALHDLSKRDPGLFYKRRFLEILVPTRADSRVYADNYREMSSLISAINAQLGHTAIHTIERIEDRMDVAAAMQHASKAMFTSIEDGYNMTVPETLVNWSVSRKLFPKNRQMIATEDIGFVQSLKDYGLDTAISVAPSPLQMAAFRSMMERLLRNQLQQPHYARLEPYFATNKLKDWMNVNVGTNVRKDFSRDTRHAA